MKKQLGLSLIELMIALTTGLIVLLAIVSIYAVVVRGNSDTLKSIRLNHDLDSAMNLMVNDIRRAGYWSGAIINVDMRNNPFTTTNNLVILNNNSCILYSYDKDADGKTDSETSTNDTDGDGEENDNEFYGFKLQNQEIMIRLSGSSNNDCNNGTWKNLADTNQLNISKLLFEMFRYSCVDETNNISKLVFLSSECPISETQKRYPLCFKYDSPETECDAATKGNFAHKRVIKITLEGNLKSDQTVQHKLESIVEIRNGRLFEIK